MKALRWAGPSDAAPALLLHGLTSCAETWSLVAPLLAAERAVIALDLRGHGETDKPGHGYEQANVAADVAGALDALGVAEACVVGHSWGGGVALRLAAEHPQRVRRLVLADGGILTRREGPLTPERAEQMLAPSDIYRTVETYFAEFRRTLNGHWTPEIEAIALAAIEHNADGSVRERLDREHQKLILHSGWSVDMAALYGRVQCPVLVLPAENMTATPERREARKAQVAETAALLPDSRVHWVAESVHDIQLHKPHAVAEQLREHFA
jgi:pimeloyl-ACP methyl ester carboxylesterase